MSLKEILQKQGRFPPVKLVLSPLDQKGVTLTLDKFLNYQFDSSILIPVDTFKFSFVNPDSTKPLNAQIKEGDLVQLIANNTVFSTGIIDTTDVETDSDFAEKGEIGGRDMLSQLEDQDAISFDDKPIYANQLTALAAGKRIIQNTRIPGVLVQDGPPSSYLFATEPGENKIQALQRYVEPLNCIFWNAPDGRLVIGRPNMAQDSLGTLFVSKSSRSSNVISMKAIRASASIANLIVSVWTGQENVQHAVAPSQRVYNSAEGPTRLRKLGHIVSKSVVTSNPDATDPQGYAALNQFVVSSQSGNILQAYAKKALASMNHKELIVQAVVPGHFNENGDPFKIDTTYFISYDRGDVNEKMYLFQCQYILDENGGQKTNLFFCRMGTIVSDIRAR